MRLSGLAQMNVDINQAGCNDEATGIEGLGFFTRLWCGYFAIRKPEIGDLVAVVGGVDDATVGDTGDFHAGMPAPPAQR